MCTPVRVRRAALTLGLLAALLWGGVVGCAALHQPPVKSLEQWQREDRAVLSLGD
jgi:hypothetical protein